MVTIPDRAVAIDREAQTGISLVLACTGALWAEEFVVTLDKTPGPDAALKKLLDEGRHVRTVPL
jgi:hypothetical protein